MPPVDDFSETQPMPPEAWLPPVSEQTPEAVNGSRSNLQKVSGISEAAYEILRAAVTLVRTEQIQRVGTLRSRLQQRYPGKDNQVQEALQFWARHATANRSA
jgi:hypothetical protein